ncbi:methyltransferase domain-containing protein [Pelagerythrobacter sp.]|uniref:methyltransferase domain-containing protein n=1 Tax=Pelagerythrobacter sp. TaxID=2800702 RepID=UPI0035AE680A
MELQRGADAADFVFRAMAEELGDRLGFIDHRMETALVIGDPTGLAVEALDGSAARIVSHGPDAIDEEAALDGRYDLVASLGSLDTVNDVPGALLHMREALAPGGIAIASFLGAGSLPNLRRALLAAEPERPAARMHPMIDMRAASALLQRAGFARQVADSFTLRVRYGSLDRLVADLRAQGLTNVLASTPPTLSRAAMERAQAAFLDQADTDGKVVEPFEIITLTGWKS